MKQLSIKPDLYQYQTCKEFCEDFQVGADDLMITNERIYKRYLNGNSNGCTVVFQENYGAGEPSDEMVEKIYYNLKDINYQRVIAIGGGSILDIAKLFALQEISPVEDLFEGKIKPIKTKELIMVPTTCGTGSEVTNISVLNIASKQTKQGMYAKELYADYAVLIPELLECLPFQFFVTSSIDAFIHSIESYLSGKATEYTKMFSMKAMEIILNGYKKIAEDGPDARLELSEEFLRAANYAGIAFGNAGCAAVHALSYALGSKYHVPHGEANYVMFTAVFKVYEKLKPDGEIKRLNKFLSKILVCDSSDVYDEIEKLFNQLLEKKSLREYGVQREELAEFTESVIEKQGRLMQNNYTILDKNQVYHIYENVY